MSTAVETPDQKPTLHPEFVKNMVRTFNDSDEHGVHLLFNEWWPHAPDSTIERYLDRSITAAAAVSAAAPMPPGQPIGGAQSPAGWSACSW